MNNDLANEIRRKTDIVDIIGERIPLVARGKNFFGVCPFHDDSNPSMCVSREKQIYTCFSCHATGNVFTFLMNYEHIDFRETLRYLGDKVGIDTGSIKIAKKSTKFDNLAATLLGAVQTQKIRFGQGGALGSEGFADRETGFALAFTKNKDLPEHPRHMIRNRISAVLGLPERIW